MAHIRGIHVLRFAPKLSPGVRGVSGWLTVLVLSRTHTRCVHHSVAAAWQCTRAFLSTSSHTVHGLEKHVNLRSLPMARSPQRNLMRTSAECAAVGSWLLLFWGMDSGKVKGTLPGKRQHNQQPRPSLKPFVHRYKRLPSSSGAADGGCGVGKRTTHWISGQERR